MGLDGVELIMEVEDKFGIAIPDEISTEMHTVGALIDYVQEVTRERGVDPRAAKNQVRRIVANQMGLRLRDVRPEHTFIELGLT